MPLAWFATAPIEFANVRAFSPGHHVPDSIVARFGLDAAGKVEQREITYDPPGYNVALAPLLRGDVDSDEERELLIPSRLSDDTLRAAFVPREEAGDLGGIGVAVLSGRVAFFGDSITAYLYQYPKLAEALSLGRFQRAGIYSHGGFSTDQLVPLVSDFTEANPLPGKVVILAGTNDAQGNVPVPTFTTNLTAIVDAALDAGIDPVVCTIPPLGADFTAASRAKVTAYNAQVKLLANERGLHLIDYHDVLTDPVTGAWRAGYDDGDGIHPSYAAQLAMAEAASAVLTPVAPAGVLPLAMSNADPANLFSNALALTDTGGDGPDGWDLWNPSMTGVAYSTEAAEDVRGRWATMTLTGRTEQAQMQNRRVEGFAAGDQVYFAAMVKTSGLSGSGAGFALYVNWYVAYGGEIVRTDQIGDGGPVDSGPMLYASTFTAPAGATQVSVQLTAAASTGVYQLGQVTGYDLTALGIA